MVESPFTVDVASLTLGELATIEELTGLGLRDTLLRLRDGSAADSAQFVTALTLIANPELSFDDVRRLTISDLESGDGET